MERKAPRTAVFIDGAHLSKGMRKAFPGVHIAYDKLAARVAGTGELLYAFYYDALPYVSNDATVEERERCAKHSRFFHAIGRLPHFEVREGRCARVWNRDRGEWSYTQKHVDVLLATDLVRLAAKGQIDVAVLVTGDSDFVPAVKIAKQEGVKVGLLCSPIIRETNLELAATVDERMVIDAAFVDEVRIPRVA